MFAIQFNDANDIKLDIGDEDNGGFFNSMKEAVDYFRNKTDNFKVDYFIMNKTTPFLVNSDIGVIDCSVKNYFKKMSYNSLDHLYSKMCEGECISVGGAGGPGSFHSYQIVPHNTNY